MGLYTAGEKISPVEIDAALLSHTAVAQAVAFAAPDAKYGEEVSFLFIMKKVGMTIYGRGRAGSTSFGF